MFDFNVEMNLSSHTLLAHIILMLARLFSPKSIVGFEIQTASFKKKSKLLEIRLVLVFELKIAHFQFGS